MRMGMIAIMCDACTGMLSIEERIGTVDGLYLLVYTADWKDRIVSTGDNTQFARGGESGDVTHLA